MALFLGFKRDSQPAKLSDLAGGAAAAEAEAEVADGLLGASLLFLSRPPHCSCGNLLEPGIYEFFPLVHGLGLIGHLGSNLRGLSAAPNEFV